MAARKATTTNGQTTNADELSILKAQIAALQEQNARLEAKVQGGKFLPKLTTFTVEKGEKKGTVYAMIQVASHFMVRKVRAKHLHDILTDVECREALKGCMEEYVEGVKTGRWE